jgi:hypothetical protein
MKNIREFSNPGESLARATKQEPGVWPAKSPTSKPLDAKGAPVNTRAEKLRFEKFCRDKPLFAANFGSVCKQ